MSPAASRSQTATRSSKASPRVSAALLPTTRYDETVVPDLIYLRSMYGSNVKGAFDVLGVIREKYASLGWEAGVLGYPVSDEHDIAGGRRSDFQHGSITWTAATNDGGTFCGAEVAPDGADAMRHWRWIVDSLGSLN